MTPVDQATIEAAQATIQAAQAAQSAAVATWSLFWATIVLVVVTLAAVIVGGLAAQRATETYRLEAEPVLIVTHSRDTGEGDLLRYFVTGKPSLVEGIELRPWTVADSPPVAQGFTQAYGGGPPKPSIILEVANVGRSPAVGVSIDIVVSVRTSYKPGAAAVGFVRDEKSASTSLDWSEDGVQSGAGTVHIPAIAPQGRMKIRVENGLGLQVSLDVKQDGRRQRWDTKSRTEAQLPVIAPQGSILIKAPIG